MAKPKTSNYNLPVLTSPQVAKRHRKGCALLPSDALAFVLPRLKAAETLHNNSDLASLLSLSTLEIYKLASLIEHPAPRPVHSEHPKATANWLLGQGSADIPADRAERKEEGA